MSPVTEGWPSLLVLMTLLDLDTLKESISISTGTYLKIARRNRRVFEAVLWILNTGTQSAKLSELQIRSSALSNLVPR
jgi:hypothetical protein